MDLHRPSGRARLGLGLAVTTMLLWGLLPLALKVTLRAMDPATIVWYRFLAATCLMGALLAARGRLPRLRSLSRTAWGLLGAATVFLAINYVTYLHGLDHTTPANAQVLIQLAPVLLSLGGILVFRERFTGLQWAGFAVLLVGLVAFVGDQTDLAADVATYRLGNTFMVVAAVTWAIYGLAQKQLLRSLSSPAVMLCVYAGCTVLFTPLGTPASLANLDGIELGLLAFCALNTAVAYGTFAEALVHWEASRVGAVLALTPVATLVFGAATSTLWPDLVATANVSAVGLLGAGLVVAGSLLTSLGRSARGYATAPASRSAAISSEA